MRQPTKLFVRLFLLCGLVACFWVLPRAISESDAIHGEKNISVIVTQLERENGFPPLEVKCTPPQLNDTNQLTGFSCTLRNNTTRNIAAVSLSYSLVLGGKGTGIVKDTHAWAIVSLIHPDFRETYKPIAPGTETIMNAAKLSFADVVPSAIELGVDYVEFEDGTTLGPNITGAKIIADMRSGAALYKEWLVHEYIKRGKSESELASLVERDTQAMPDELHGLKSNGNQEHGAKAYATLLRKLFVLKGPAEVKRLFPR